jgi:hypothetical protein
MNIIKQTLKELVHVENMKEMKIDLEDTKASIPRVNLEPA